MILVDTRRVQESFAAINYFEHDSNIPFIVALNLFDGELPYELDEGRDALALSPETPLTTCDARDPESAVESLRTLVTHTMRLNVTSGTA